MDQKNHVYEAICAVTADMAREGVQKGRQNEHDRYFFRGIDDIYNALAPSLTRNKLVMLPRVTERSVVERQSAKGMALFYVVVHVEFDFVSAVDGSRHTIATYGEAMDRSDKATNKAMSAAYKYAAMQAFCIPTEGENDADAVTHEVGYDGSVANVATTAKVNGRYKVSGPLSKTEMAGRLRALRADLEETNDIDQFDGLLNDNRDLLEQAERDFPEWFNKVDADAARMPPEFVPLNDMLERRRREILTTERTYNGQA